jgi:hypothetical protein
MSIPEGYLPRNGDEVLIRARAKRDARPEEPDIECYLEIIGKEHQKFFLKASEIHSVYARCWNIGDTVTGDGLAGPAEVLAVDGRDVWVRDVGGARWTVEANELAPYVEPPAPALTVTPVGGEVQIGDTVTGAASPFYPGEGKIVAVAGEDGHENPI